MLFLHNNTVVIAVAMKYLHRTKPKAGNPPPMMEGVPRRLRQLAQPAPLMQCVYPIIWLIKPSLEQLLALELRLRRLFVEAQ